MNILESIMTGFTNQVRGPQGHDPRQTAAAYKSLQDALTSTRAAGEESYYAANPDAEEGSYEGPSAIERWKNQVNAMITSGDPVLQKEGLGMLQSYHQQATKAPSDPKRSSAAQMAIELGYKPGTKPYNDFILGQANKSGGTTVNIGGNERGQYLTKDEKIEGGLDPDAPFVWTSDGPKPVGQSKETEKTSALNTVGTMTAELDNMLFGDNGLMDADEKSDIPAYLKRTIRGNLQDVIKTDPRYADYQDYAGGILSSIARTIGGEKGAISDGDVKRVSGLIPQITGYKPDTAATAKAKLKKLQNLIETAKKRGGLTSEEITEIIGAEHTPRTQRTKIPRKPPVTPAQQVDFNNLTVDDSGVGLPEGYTWDD